MLTIIFIPALILLVLILLIIGNKNPKHLVFIQLYYCLFIYFFITTLNFPRSLLYFMDLNNLILIGFVIKKKKCLPTILKPFLLIHGFYFLFITCTALVNSINLPLFFWGLRNTFRFPIFLIVATIFLAKPDIKKILTIFKNVLYINTVIILIQFLLIAEVDGDLLNGIFGAMKGGNASLNVLLIIVVSYAFVSLYNLKSQFACKKEEAVLMIFCGLLIATLSELKIFYFELIIIFIFNIILNRKQIKTLIILIVGIILYPLIFAQVGRLFPAFKDFFTVEVILEYLGKNNKGYGNASSLNRLNSIPIISEMFLKDPIQKLSGIGFGNAEISQFSWLRSTFYITHGSSDLKYDWFSHAFIFLETGYLGLALYISTFVTMIIQGFKRMKKSKIDNFITKNFIILNFLSLLLIIYNSSLRIDTAGYMIYLALALFYVHEKKEVRQDEKN